MEDPKIKLGVIVGPTASGKTALAVEMARRFDGEIVSADSMQIYQGMPVSTACPTPEEKGSIPHHMLEFLPLSRPYSVAEYVKDAAGEIRRISERGKLPILVGGTGLYVRSLLENRQYEEEPEHAAVRASLADWSEGKSNEELYACLLQEDPGAAMEIHPNNRKRVLRAIERYRLTGRTLQEQNQYSLRVPSPYLYSMVGLTCEDRSVLYGRIDRRVDQMMENGMLQEAQSMYHTPQAETAAQAIGCKELFPYLEGAVPLEEAVQRIKQGTRRYAKRQITWFQREKGIHWLYTDRMVLQEGESVLDGLCRACAEQWRADRIL